MGQRPFNFPIYRVKVSGDLHTDSAEALGEKVKATIQAKVEHLFLGVKQTFWYANVRYRGPVRNSNRMALPLGLSNLRWSQAFQAPLLNG